VVPNTPKTPAVKSVKRKKGQLATMAFVAMAKAHTFNANPIEVAKEMYGDQEDVQIMVKAATAPADTTTATWAAELVREGYGEFMDLLLPATIYGRIPSVLNLNFGKDGSIVLPSWAEGRDLSGGFVAQGAPIPVKQGAFGTTVLTPKKMAVISTFTKEVFSKSIPAIEMLVRNAIIQDTAKAIDAALLDNGARSAIRPAGLQDATGTGAANINASAGATVANIIADANGVFTRLSAAEMGERGVWLMNPARVYGLQTKQLTTGQFAFPEVFDNTFMGHAIVKSTSVPADVVAFIDEQSFIKASDVTPNFSVSDQATLVMADDADEISTGGASAAGVTANAVRSLYQTDTMALKFTLGLDWMVYRKAGVQILNTVAW